MLSQFSSYWKRLQEWWRSIPLEMIQKFRLKKEKRELGAPKGTILCIDDDPDFCLYIERLALSLGIMQHSAYSIKEAKQAIVDNPSYYAYVIDGYLPDGSGVDLVAWIRERDNGNIPICFVSRIYLSAGNFRQLKEELKVDIVLEKPLRAEEVSRLLKKLCHLEENVERKEDELLGDLKSRYQQSIYGKLESIEKRILDVQKMVTVENLQDLKREVHNISGTAGSFGYSKAGEVCREMDLQINQQIERLKTSSLDPAWLQGLDDFFSKLKFYFQMDD
jgi:CheY-like chemotaxis protein